MDAGSIIGFTFAALSLLYLLPKFYAKCCIGASSLRGVSAVHLAGLIGRGSEGADLEARSSVVVQPLTNELIGGMTSLFNDGFGNKWACFIFPVYIDGLADALVVLSASEADADG